MSVEELAELDISRNMPNEVLTAQGILDYLENMYTAYEDRYEESIDIPEIMVEIGGFQMGISAMLDSPDDKMRIKRVVFEDVNMFVRACYIDAEYVA